MKALQIPLHRTILTILVLVAGVLLGFSEDDTKLLQRTFSTPRLTEVLLNTNILFLKPNPDGSVYFISMEELAKHTGVTNLVNSLVTNGIICQVRGHRWQPYIDTHLVYYPNGAPQYRQCGVCDVIQSRSPGEWK